MQTRRLIVSALVVGLVAAGVAYYLYYLRDGVSSTPPAQTKHSSGEPPGPPLFEDVTAASGVTFTYQNGEDLVDADGQPVKDEQGNPRRHLAILESLGGGLALIDYDG